MTDPGLDIFDLALACYRTPLAYQNRMSLAAPLPRDMNRLLWLANGSPETLGGAVRQTGSKADELRDAARFLVQQLCFARGASHYRVLGLEPDATVEQIKEHHRLLIRLFHPDRAGGDESWTDHFASRVNEAWTVLSRAQPRAVYDAGGSPSPSQVVVPVAVDSTVSFPTRPIHVPRSRKSIFLRVRNLAPRRWIPTLVLGGFALAAVLAVWNVYETRPHVVVLARPTPETQLDPETSLADPDDRSAITALLVAPDWQALGQRERQAHRRVNESRAAQEKLEQAHRERLAADVALLEQIRAERTRLEEQLRAEHLRAERTWSERLAAEQAKLEQLKAEQLQTERARDERLAAEQVKLKQLKAEQAKAEQMAEALRIEREQLERNRVDRSGAAPVRQARPGPPTNQPADPASESRRVGVAPAETLVIEELDGLIKRYTNAYRRGDLDSLMVLFAADARGRSGSSRDGIRRDYGTLFDAHWVRRMLLRDLRWTRGGDSASAVGRYEVWLRRRDNGGSIQLAGSIRFEVRKRDGRLSIVAIDYDWPRH